MKTFQKIALVSAIAAAPFAAQADLTPMDDSLMGNTTGQAGVTIEIDLGTDGIGIGSVVYTDTAHDVQVTDANGVEPGDAGYIETLESRDGGTVTLENIKVGLTGVLTQTIDVGANGDLNMTMSSPGTLSISAGGDSATQVGAYSALKLGGNGDSEIINNLSLDVALGDSTTTIKNLGSAATLGMGALSNAGVVGADYENMQSSMAIQMTASANVSNMNVGLFGYTRAQAEAIAAANPSGPTADQIAGGSAVQLSGVSISQAGSGGTGMFSVDQVIWAVGGDASQPGSEAGVYIQMGEMDLDINVAGVGIGGSSIGSLAVNGLELNGLTQRIYGH